MHTCNAPHSILGVCHDIIKSLEKHKAEDLAQRKEMLKKKQEEQHSRKKGLRKRNNSGNTILVCYNIKAESELISPCNFYYFSFL